MNKLLAASVFALIATPVIAGDSFSHKHLNLDLPAGWSAHPAAAADAPHLGTLKSANIPGTSITLDCYRGKLHSQASTRIRALKTVAAAYPAGQEQLAKEKKIKTRGGKGSWETWKGFVNIGNNQMVTLVSPMASIKTPDCWLVMVGYTAEANAGKLETDFLSILNSAR